MRLYCLLLVLGVAFYPNPHLKFQSQYQLLVFDEENQVINIA